MSGRPSKARNTQAKGGDGNFLLKLTVVPESKFIVKACPAGTVNPLMLTVVHCTAVDTSGHNSEHDGHTTALVKGEKMMDRYREDLRGKGDGV